MRKVRIGNDINVRWEVKTDGQAVSLEGKALKLYVRSAYRKEEITTFTVEGCVVSFTYPASMQRMTGARAVILEDATEGAPRRTVCADQAFTLVAHTCEENDDDVEFENFMVSLQSNVLIGKPGLSAYEVWLSEGNTGTLADWYAYLQKPATDVAAEVTKAETARVEAEKKREEAETARQDNEAARQKAENGRAKAELKRTDAEQERADAELLRKIAETKREQAEEKREEAIDDLAEKLGLKANKNETIVEIKRLTGKQGREWNANTDTKEYPDFKQYLISKGNYCGFYINILSTNFAAYGFYKSYLPLIGFGNKTNLAAYRENSTLHIGIFKDEDFRIPLCEFEIPKSKHDVIIIAPREFIESTENYESGIGIYVFQKDSSYHNSPLINVEKIISTDTLKSVSSKETTFDGEIGFISYTNSNNYRVKYADGRYALINADKNVVIGGKDYNADLNYNFEGFGENGTTFTRNGTLKVNGSATVRDLTTRSITANGSVTINNELKVKKSISTNSTLKAGETTIKGTLHCETHDIKTKSVYPAGTGSSSFKDPSLGSVEGNYVVNKGNLGKPAHNYDKLFVENIYWSDCTDFYDEATSLNGDGLVPIYERKGFYGSPTFYLTEALNADTAQTSFLYYDDENNSFCFETRIESSNEGYDIFSQFRFKDDGTISSHMGEGVRGNGVWYNDESEDNNIPFYFIKNIDMDDNEYGDMVIKNVDSLSFTNNYVSLSATLDRLESKGYLFIKCNGLYPEEKVRYACVKALNQELYIESKNGTSTSVFATDGSHFDLNKKADLVDGKVPLSQLGNVDTQIVLVVDALPTENIKSNKIYLVKNTASEDTENIYTEYVYINNKWEELGKYKPEVDLSEYVKSNEIYQCIKKEYDSSKRNDNSIVLDDTATCSGRNSVVIGNNAKSDVSSGDSILIGYNSNMTNSEYCTAVGYYVNATNADYSVALGQFASVNTANAIAIGNSANVKADSSYSAAIGTLANVSKSKSIAIGYNASCDGINSIALGTSASTMNDTSVAIGASAQAKKNKSLALGANAISTDSYSTAIGYGAKSSGIYSTAIGSDAEAISDRGIAIGCDAKTTKPYAIAIGKNVKNSKSIFSVGFNGTNGIDMDAENYGLYLRGFGGYTGTNLTVNNAAGKEVLNPDIKSVQEIINGKVDITPIIASTDAAIALQPNKKYEITAGDTLTLTLAESVDNTVVNEYKCAINTGNNVSVVTFPQNVIWATEPVIEANKHYEISIIYSQEKYWGTIQAWNLPTESTINNQSDN